MEKTLLVYLGKGVITAINMSFKYEEISILFETNQLCRVNDIQDRVFMIIKLT